MNVSLLNCSQILPACDNGLYYIGEKNGSDVEDCGKVEISPCRTVKFEICYVFVCMYLFVFVCVCVWFIDFVIYVFFFFQLCVRSI
jgi:hypothetical protein